MAEKKTYTIDAEQIEKAWDYIQWLERSAALAMERSDYDMSTHYSTKADAMRCLMDAFGLAGTEIVRPRHDAPVAEGLRFVPMTSSDRYDANADEDWQAWTAHRVEGDGWTVLNVVHRDGGWVAELRRDGCYEVRTRETPQEAVDAALEGYELGRGAGAPVLEHDAAEGAWLAFRPMDRDDRGFYIADAGYGAWLWKTADPYRQMAVVHCDGCWRAEVEWTSEDGHEYVNGAWREFSTPQEAAQAVWGAYRGVLAGTEKQSDWQ